jgi:hypothetical protein
VILLFVLSLLPRSEAGVKAQVIHTWEQQQKAYDLLEELETGTLIIILKTNSNKLEHLENQLKGQDLSKAQRKRYQKIYDKEIEERTTILNSLTQAFNNLYRFSDFRFIYDYDLEKFQSGELDHFLDQDRVRDETISLDTSRSWFYLMERYTQDSEGSRVYALVVLDKDLNQIDAPFPNYVKLTSFGPVKIYKLIVGKSEYVSMYHAVDRLDTKFVNRKQILKEKLIQKTTE